MLSRRSVQEIARGNAGWPALSYPFPVPAGSAWAAAGDIEKVAVAQGAEADDVKVTATVEALTEATDYIAYLYVEGGNGNPVGHSEVSFDSGESVTAEFVDVAPGNYYAAVAKLVEGAEQGYTSSLNNTDGNSHYRVNPATHNETQADKDWASIVPEYSVEKVDAVYSVGVNDVFAVKAVKDVFGNEVKDYSALYANADGTLTTDTVDKKIGGYPVAPAHTTDYQVLVVKGDVSGLNLDAVYNIDGLREAGYPTLPQKFTITVEQKSLAGAAVYEYDANGASFGIDDETVVYKGAGKGITIGFKLDGTALTANDVSGVAVKSAPSATAVSTLVDSLNTEANPTGGDGVGVTITADANGQTLIAGDYVLTIFGTGSYSGSVDVPFTVEKLDLAQAVATVPNVTGNVALYGGTKFKVGDVALADNDALASDRLKVLDQTNGVTAYSKVDPNGATTTTFADMNSDGTYTYKLTANADNKNVEGTGFPVVNHYSKVVTFKYDDKKLDGTFTKGNPFETFYASKGEAFDPAELSCSDASVDFTYKFYDAEGAEVTDLSAPGLYKVVVTAAKYADYSIGGTGEGWFEVKATDFDPANVTAYAAIDGKMLNADTAVGFEYTAEAFAPQVVVKEGSKTVSSDLYTVVVEDADGNAVDSAVEPGDYTVVVKFNGFDEKSDKSFKFKVTRVLIESAKASAEFFAEGVTPTFVGSSDIDFDKGKKFDLASDQISVTYHDANGRVVKAEDLEEGTYYADITILTTDKHFEGTVDRVEVVIAKTAVYADVPADAWYADSVYKASQYGFMEGVASGIFAPERTMTRAEFAQTVYNMAHEDGEQGSELNGQTYPTQFSDVASDAWFAKAVEWAARYGIVTGKSATEFDPYGTVTREEIATMLYRYIGNGAKADASVLDEFEDKAEVCDWAVDAMAWAVEEGVVNGVSETSLAPHGDAQRCMVAAMAVRAQPERIENM